jgi:arylsulfatase A-like enzyme
MTMPGRTGTLEETSTTGSIEPRTQGAWLRPHQIVLLSLWCGLVAGPLEVLAIVVRKHTIDLNRFYWMSRHFVWLIPLTNLLIFLGLGLAFWLIAVCSRSGRWLAVRLLCALTLLPPFLAGFPRVYGLAWSVLALGTACRLVPALELRAAGFRRCVVVSFPVLISITPLLAGSFWAGDWLAQAREAARRLPPPGSPNVLLIVLDTVAADHLSLYGYSRRTSPTLEALAQRGVRFDRAQATSSWTLPSHAGFFTGHWPHDLSASWFTPLDASHRTLAEYLAAHGYATAGFVANTAFCGADTGLARGFTIYQDYFFPELSAFKMAVLINRPVEGLRSLDLLLREHLNLAVLRPLVRPIWGRFNADARKEAPVVHRELLDWLTKHRQSERPFFAFLNFYDAHYPYELPNGSEPRFGGIPHNPREAALLRNWWTIDKRRLSGQEIAFVRDAYDECVAGLDDQVGRVLGDLGRQGMLEHTWLIITSDHGESFGEQPGFFGHGTSLYQPQLHVPLLIVPPTSSPKPARPIVPTTVSLRDLPATVVDLVGLKADAPFPGTSLVPLWGGPASETVVGPQGRFPALSEVVPLDPVDPESAELLDRRQVWASLAEGDWIYIWREGGEPEELFDLRVDRGQRHNRAADPAAQSRLAEMRQTLIEITAGPLTHERFNP